MNRQRFDDAWYFKLDDPTIGFWLDSTLTPERLVDLPHDWSVEFDRDPNNPSGALGGFFKTGLGVYRKNFSIPESWHGKKVFIEFEGVFMNAEVWINAHFMGNHPYGYTSFAFDLTPYLDFRTDNSIKVVVNNATQLNSRWYSGSGIYRHVWLMVADQVHVDHWGVFVTTPEITPSNATVSVSTRVLNESDVNKEVTLKSHIRSPSGGDIGEAETSNLIPAGGHHTYIQELSVSEPLLWSPENPHRYRLDTEVIVGGQIVDTDSTRFGIRSLYFNAGSGFLLNGVPTLLKGGCVHHDNGVMGAASYDRSEERKVALLKASGFNAVRCAHNPPAPAFLDVCDRLGMLVIDEAFDMWRAAKTPNDYHVYFDDWWQRDVESMVRRDRNHPSIIMWSIANEVYERGLPEGVAIAQMLAGHIRSLDPTRPITSGVNGLRKDGVKIGFPPEMDDFFDVLDVCGYNYQNSRYRPDHQRVPARLMYGSESAPAEAFDHWMSVLELDHVIGDFVWTSLDYLGESGIGRVHFDDEPYSFLPDYPWHQANCGDFDLCGFKRPQSYYRDILWGVGDPLYIAVHPPAPEGKTWAHTFWGWPDVWPDWNWPGREGEIFKVDVYADCEQVELFLNEESLGVKPSTRDERFIATFEVPYKPGTLRAVGYTDRREAAECEIKTINAPTTIRLTPDRRTIQARSGDLCFITVELVDQAGLVHPNANQAVFFTAKGQGCIAAVGNGNPISTEKYRGNQRQAFRGRCLVVIKSNGIPGEIVLRAHADGLDGAEIVIRAVEQR